MENIEQKDGNNTWLRWWDWVLLRKGKQNQRTSKNKTQWTLFPRCGWALLWFFQCTTATLFRKSRRAGKATLTPVTGLVNVVLDSRRMKYHDIHNGFNWNNDIGCCRLPKCLLYIKLGRNFWSRYLRNFVSRTKLGNWRIASCCFILALCWFSCIYYFNSVSLTP